VIKANIYFTNTYFFWTAVAKTGLYEDLVIFMSAKTHLTNSVVNFTRSYILFSSLEGFLVTTNGLNQERPYNEPPAVSLLSAFTENSAYQIICPS